MRRHLVFLLPAVLSSAIALPGIGHEVHQRQGCGMWGDLCGFKGQPECCPELECWPPVEEMDGRYCLPRDTARSFTANLGGR
ncbi:hypothetical protein FE257_000776 [Aspergillus nanangensis]|uniref:Uncharacterized protein n=1 Tax=Aspergillus nanangensis TaxID=2582783 RepID=A0AAD4CEP4_ASPNN|nr:hypothetical protein FE257_000776 [Aspergillus nanangensis]